MDEKINMYCLPFAGGSKYSYQKFSEHESDSVKFIPIEMPGRGRRMKESLLTDIHKMVDDAFDQICNDLDSPYAIFGHSMGSVTGYLLTHKIINHQLPQPLHLFFSGAHGPSLPLDESPRYLLPKDEFIQKLKDLGGSPDEVLNDPQLMMFFEPLLRADFEAIDTYKYKESNALNIPMTVMIGEDEDISDEEAMSWQKESTNEIDLIRFAGNHFFIFDHQKAIAELMEKKLPTRMVGYGSI